MLIIPGTLPGLNEIIDAAKKGKRGYQPYADMKRHYCQIISVLAYKMDKHTKPVNVFIDYYEPTAKRDPDNIAAGGAKLILDSLVKAGVIQNDTQKYIKSITQTVSVDRDNPRVVVDLKEVE
jgi:Holliday junction resolvase RusA-like endonuclease